MLSLGIRYDSNSPFGDKLAAALSASLLLHGLAVFLLDLRSPRGTRLGIPPPLRVELLIPQIATPEVLPAPTPQTSAVPAKRPRAPRSPSDHDELRDAIPPLPTRSEAQAPPDLESARDIARTIAREPASRHGSGIQQRSSGFKMSEAEPEAAPTPMAQAINRAENADCREKYAGAGLLGLPLLLKDQFVADGCRW